MLEAFGVYLGPLASQFAGPLFSKHSLGASLVVTAHVAVMVTYRMLAGGPH